MVTQAEVEERKRLRLEQEEKERKRRQAEKAAAKSDPYRESTLIEKFQGRVARTKPVVEETPRDTTSIGFSGLTDEERAARIAETGKTGAELEAEQRARLTTPEVIRDQDTGELSGITRINGNTTLGIGARDITNISRSELLPRAAPLGTSEAGTAQQAGSQQAINQSLIQDVGNIDPSTGLQPTGLDYGEAFTTGLVSAIPRALSLAGGAAVAGAAAGALTTGGVLSVPLAAAGAAVTFAGSITSSMISNFKSQRTDTTTAQQRVLDEGKQTLKDWATQAKADPANRNFYLGQFNLQLQQIQDAHTQMLIDTNADVAKFETALPNLAEFNSFYSVGGERDALINEMVAALQTPSTTEWEMLELANRRL